MVYCKVEVKREAVRMVKYKRVNTRNKKGLKEAEKLQRRGWMIYRVGWDSIDFYKKIKNNKGQANIFGIVGLVYLGLMLVVLITIF